MWRGQILTTINSHLLSLYNLSMKHTEEEVNFRCYGVDYLTEEVPEEAFDYIGNSMKDGEPVLKKFIALKLRRKKRQNYRKMVEPEKY